LSSNQPPPLVDYNLFEADAPLRESLEREGASWAHDLVHELGRLAGTQQAIDWGFQANANPPHSTPTTGSETASTRSSSILPGTS
jgi:Adaptive response protein AidB N-terminal domain